MHSINSPLKSNGILWTKSFALLFSPTAQSKSSSEIQHLFRSHIFHDYPSAFLSNSWPIVLTLLVFLWFRQELLEGVVEKRISFHPGLEFPCSIDRFSYKINLADTSFSPVCCDKPHFILKIEKPSVDGISTFPTLQRTEQDEENGSFGYVRYNERLIQSFECFQGHSTHNKGFGKFRDV